jgi:cell division protein FtsI (penicillin-binding protein 3)
MKQMGFGSRTDIGFVGEETGILRHYKNWQAIEFSNIAFGQGITVTGIQMATAYSAVANGGTRLDPVLVTSVKNSAGQSVVENKSDTGTEMMPVPASTVLLDMLYSVTQTGGTATSAHIDGYLSAGKTGTAQKVNAKSHAYQAGEFVSSFIGMAPADRPRVIVYVVLDTPRKNGYFGGVAAAPAFKKITEQALAYLGVAPTHPLAQKKPTTPEPASDKLTSKKVLPSSTDKLPLALADLSSLNNWIATRALESLKKNTVPDLRGLSLRRALKITQDRKIELKLKGSGIVVKQSIAPGQPLPENGILEVEMGGQS